jgi:hypothetical protein
MTNQVPPIVQILMYAREYSPTRRVSLDAIEFDFVQSCVTKLVSGYALRFDMIHLLINAIDKPDINMITRGDVTRWGLVDTNNLNRMFDSHDDSCAIRYLYLRHVGMTGIYSIALAISWVEALYAGLQVLRLSLELRSAHTCRDNALQTLAEFNSTNSMSDQDDSDIEESLDLTACRIDLDYLII